MLVPAKRCKLRFPRGTPLTRSHPKLSQEWHMTRNGGLMPKQVSGGSELKVWWECGKPGHEWQAAVTSRISSRSGCPFCIGRRVTPESSLAGLFPGMMKQWDAAKNRGIDPFTLAPRSNRKVWWKCAKGPDHQWQANPLHRNRSDGQPGGCPFCSGNRVSVTNSLARRFPKIAAEWHPVKNGRLSPDELHAGADKKVWWRCGKNPTHEWAARVESRTRLSSGCPYCAGAHATPERNLARFSPELMKQWHPVKNGSLRPETLTPHSKQQVWWRCPKGKDHEWRVSPGNRTGKAKSGCPFCAGRRVSVTNSLVRLYPHIAAQWDHRRNGKLSLLDVTAGSHRMAWWKCVKGKDHAWRVRVVWRTREDTGCPFCIGKKVSSTNSLAARHPEIAAQWHPRGNRPLSPENVVAGSGKKVWWKCGAGKGHEWQATLQQRTTHQRHCPFCSGRSIPENRLLANSHPEIAREWHPSRNGNKTPRNVAFDSYRIFWWRCRKGRLHEWQETVFYRTEVDHRCPECG